MLTVLKGVIADIVLKQESSLLLFVAKAPFVNLEGLKSFATIEPVRFLDISLVFAFEIITGGFDMPSICLFFL
jgi:hypothetical protein